MFKVYVKCECSHGYLARFESPTMASWAAEKMKTVHENNCNKKQTVEITEVAEED